MPRDARFWRNVAIIALGHILLGIVFVAWGRETKKLEPPSFVWIGDGGDSQSDKPVSEQKETTASEPEKSPPAVSKENDTPVTPEKSTSEIQLPIVTPSPVPTRTPVPKPTPSPTPKPSSKPTPTPKSKIKKAKTTKPTPTPKSKKELSEEKKAPKEKEKPNKPKPTPGSAGKTDKQHSGATAPGGVSSRASEFSWYAKMLHDRFYSEWVQPTTSVPAGAKMSALVRIRIERDGRISKFNIVRPSGNVVVDESVQAVSKRVTQVEPIPAGLGTGNYYEVNINFALNPTQ